MALVFFVTVVQLTDVIARVVVPKRTLEDACSVVFFLPEVAAVLVVVYTCQRISNEVGDAERPCGRVPPVVVTVSKKNPTLNTPCTRECQGEP